VALLAEIWAKRAAELPANSKRAIIAVLNILWFAKECMFFIRLTLERSVTLSI
jgi:hypothetical protein